MGAAIGAVDDVVDLEKPGRAAPLCLTAAVRAADHESADARRDGLRGLHGHTVHVGIANVLRVAQSRLDHMRLDGQLASGSVAGAA